MGKFSLRIDVALPPCSSSFSRMRLKILDPAVANYIVRNVTSIVYLIRSLYCCMSRDQLISCLIYVISLCTISLTVLNTLSLLSRHCNFPPIELFVGTFDEGHTKNILALVFTPNLFFIKKIFIYPLSTFLYSQNLEGNLLP